MIKHSKHRIIKSILRIIYIALIYWAYINSSTVQQLIFLSSACILFTPVADWIVDWMSDDI